jgi:hypothetical protein
MTEAREAADPLLLYTVRKRCCQCGTEWSGPTFVPYPADREPLPGMCSACIAEGEAHLATLTRRAVAPAVAPAPELKKPTRTIEPGWWHE